MKILITGATGMLGATLVRILSNNHEVFATGNSEYKDCPVPYRQFDLSSFSYEELIFWSNPDIIIHSGALTNGNYCNRNPLEAFNVNGLSTRKLLDATNENVKIIYISTDAVFPSSLHMAKELDSVFPENIYGKSKELGEFFLLNSNRRFSIVRTTIVGLNENTSKSGFVEWIINSSLRNESISLFDDVIFNPITIWDLGIELEFLITSNSISSEILHIAGTEYCTKYEFGIKLLESLNISVANIENGSIKSFIDRAKRCSDQSMDCNYYQNKYGRELPSIDKTVQTIKKYYNE